MNEPTKSPSFKKRLIIMLALVALLLGALVGFNIFKGIAIKKYMASAGEPPQTVTTTVVAVQDWNAELQAVATLRAVRGVDISSEVVGMVRELRFHSGQTVKAGQVLVVMNDDAERAQLKTLQVAVQLARITLDRDRAQYDAQAISRAQLDADETDLQAKEAQVAQQAALLAKKTLVAPFEGRVGISTINPGQYLNPGDKIVTLQKITPILVDFHMPQQELNHLKVGRKLSLSTDAWPGKAFPGIITAINPLVDANTRNIAVEARLENPKQELLPGMFGKVGLVYGSKQSLLTLPQSAITFNPYGSTVFVVKESAPAAAKPGEGAAVKPVTSAPDKPAAPQVVQQVFITTGATRGDQVAIISGLEAGVTVVTSGQMKLKTGTPIVVNNQTVPSSDAAPTPQEK
jgi:membrane fusion protein (multidrug efflux system)